MNKNKILLFVVFLSCNIFSVAQKNSNIKPKWVGNTPISTAAEYYFIPVHSDGSLSLAAARASVKQEIISNVERTDKVTVYEVFDDNSIQEYDSSGNVTMNSTDSYQLNLKIEGSARPIKSRRIDEYWETFERGGKTVFDYHALYAVERNGQNADFSMISSVSSYGVHGLWRSAIVPGWGQLYKGSTLKGGLIMGGTVACIGAIIYTDCTRASFNSKINKTHDAKLKLHYADQRTAYTTGRNICIGALCALYVYNIVDAIVAPGARRILTSPAGSNNFSYYWSPTLTDDLGVGVVASISF